MKSKIIFRLSIVILIFSLYAPSCKRDIALPKYKTKNIIIIILDGARYSEMFGDTSHQYIPNLATMAFEGTMFTNFYNDGITNTVNGHSALMTGYYDVLNNSGGENPKYASFMQYWREQHHAEKNSCWVVATKDKLEVLNNCKDVYYRNHETPSTDCGINGLGTGYREDSVTFNRAMEKLKAFHPRMMLINFKEPDASGHAANWNGYLQGIMKGDYYAYTIWNFLKSDAFYKDQTTLFVTNDHGRHLDGWLDGYVSHGDNCEGCRHISLLALGPDFKKNYVETNRYNMLDIPTTISELLGIQMPHSGGNIMTSIFQK